MPLTFQGETAYYSPREVEMIAAWPSTPENENAARVIHMLKAKLDARMVE